MAISATLIQTNLTRDSGQSTRQLFADGFGGTPGFLGDFLPVHAFPFQLPKFPFLGAEPPDAFPPEFVSGDDLAGSRSAAGDSHVVERSGDFTAAITSSGPLPADDIDDAVADHRRQQLENLVGRLQLEFSAGHPHEEIAEQLGISVGTSKSNLAKARKQLQKILHNQNQISEIKNVG